MIVHRCAKRTKNGALRRQPLSVCWFSLKKCDEVLKPNLLYFHMRKEKVIHTEGREKKMQNALAEP